MHRLLSLTMIGLLPNLFSFPSAAGSTAKETEFVEKVKAGIAKLGTGHEARIEIKLHDKRKLKGYISESGGEGFVIVDDKTSTTNWVTYSQVKQIKGRNNLNGEKIAIAVVLLALLTVIAVLQFNCEPPNC